jgi:hypothetical protein
MDSRISKEDFLEAFKIIDSKFNNLPSIEIHITRFTAEVKTMESKLNTYNKLHNLPRLSFSVITPSDDNRSDESKAINFPHIRCVAVYDIEGKKNRLSIYVGKLEDFPKGKESEGSLKIAKEKAFNHLCKNFPNIFTDSQIETDKIDISKFLESYKEVEKLNKRISSFKKQLEQYTTRSAEYYREINEIRNKYYLPQINLTAVYPDLTVIQDIKHTITYPHLRCMATYNIANTKKRINIYIGKIEEFTDGVNDVNAIAIAREKAFNQLSKLFPQIYANMSS